MFIVVGLVISVGFLVNFVYDILSYMGILGMILVFWILVIMV